MSRRRTAAIIRERTFGVTLSAIAFPSFNRRGPSGRAASDLAERLHSKAVAKASDALPCILFFPTITMLDHVEGRGTGRERIANPSNPRENFFDRWPGRPERREAFYRWHSQVRRDFRELAAIRDPVEIARFVRDKFGEDTLRRIHEGRRRRGQVPIPHEASASNPAHRRKLRWPWVPVGRADVAIERILVTHPTVRNHLYRSGGERLPKHAKLHFAVRTAAAEPFSVHWQIVNTGVQAERAGALRGGFSVADTGRGKLVHVETTLYRGMHTIECFIVRGDRLLGRSGREEINIL